MSRTVFRSLSLLVPLLLVGGCSDDHPTRGGDMRGAVCGGLLGIGCPQSHVCELPAGECHGADLQGVCVERPGGCVQVFMPVCGCDGRTYGNDCERRAAGVQKDHDGECA